MYDIKQFKPTLYFLVLLGMMGFAVAAQSVLALLLGCGGVALNAWLVYTGRFRPVPRLFANLVTLGSMLVVGNQLITLNRSAFPANDPDGNPVLIIGHFLVVLQLVKLWEQRLNRDYGQLLVLSLLLMVAASINTNRLAFGALLLAYLFLSLYCCLLFHLKVETDRARAASAVPERKLSPAVLKQDQRHLSRSMRRLAAVVSLYGMVGAVITFLFFPRSVASGVLAPNQLQQAISQTGFSEQVNFDQITSLQADQRIIGHARVSKSGRELAGGDSIYLRGLTMDRYRSWGTSRGGFQRDSRGSRDAAAEPSNFIGDVPVNMSRDKWERVRDRFRTVANLAPFPASPPDNTTTFTQSISVTPTGTRVLFVVSATGASDERVATARDLVIRRDLKVTYGGDGAVQTEDPLGVPVDYEVISDDMPQPDPAEVFGPGPGGPGSPAAEHFELTDVPNDDAAGGPTVPGVRYRGQTFFSASPLPRHLWLRGGDLVTRIEGRPLAEIPAQRRAADVAAAYNSGLRLTIVRGGRTLTLPNIPREVEAYARRIDVSGEDEQARSLATLRARAKHVDDLDEDIARNIERHLRTQFTYSMDITDSKSRANMDPIVWFLSEDGRRGHCEYFAGAMALMCQSLGIQARVVVGFKCDEYNPFSRQFVIRQSHAHAWVEVYTKTGWKTFDPTSGRGAEGGERDFGLWQQVKHLFDWLESSYANHIIYYNNDSRENLIQSMEAQMTKPLQAGVNSGWITSRFKDSKLYKMFIEPASGPIAWTLLVGGVVGAIVLARRAWLRRRLRARAERIGLDALPRDERIRLAQQLGFYDDLLQLLERRRMARKPHQTPLEFARSLLFLPADAYETIGRLTQLFYRVRYGRQELSSGSRRRLDTVITRLDAGLP